MALNFREGMRRVGLLLGACGFVAGAAVGYFEARRVTYQANRQHQFDRVRTSETVRSVEAKLKKHWVTRASGTSVDYDALAEKFGGRRARPSTEQAEVVAELLKRNAVPPPGYQFDLANIEIPIREGEVLSITPDSQGNVVQVKLMSGDTLGPTTYQPFDYAPAIASPFVGFLIPWGIIYLLRWVLAGFFPETTSSA